MSGHTPGLWKLQIKGEGEDFYFHNHYNIIAPDRENWIVAQCINLSMENGEKEANAHRIVTAVNAHDDLLAACKAALEWFSYDEKFDLDSDFCEAEALEVQHNIRAAIAKVESGA